MKPYPFPTTQSVLAARPECDCRKPSPGDALSEFYWECRGCRGRIACEDQRLPRVQLNTRGEFQR
jgi:hypothetical protein